jgi:hypothetical protein
MWVSVKAVHGCTSHGGESRPVGTGMRFAGKFAVFGPDDGA